METTTSLRTSSKKTPAIYDLRLGLEIVTTKVEELISQNQGPIIIKVAGGSASGKTSKVSEEILTYFKDKIIRISMDDYYKGLTFMKQEEEKQNFLNWDQPEALNLELMKEHISKLKTGKEIQKPVYCMKTSEPKGVETIKPTKGVLIEGLFALQDGTGENADLNIFVDADTETRITRRIARDVERTGKTQEQIREYFNETVEPMHQKYIESTKHKADIIITNHLSAEEKI